MSSTQDRVGPEVFGEGLMKIENVLMRIRSSLNELLGLRRLRMITDVVDGYQQTLLVNSLYVYSNLPVPVSRERRTHVRVLFVLGPISR